MARKRTKLDDSPFPLTTGETAKLAAHLSVLAYEKGYAEGFQMGIDYAQKMKSKGQKVEVNK